MTAMDHLALAVICNVAGDALIVLGALSPSLGFAVALIVFAAANYAGSAWCLLKFLGLTLGGRGVVDDEGEELDDEELLSEVEAIWSLPTHDPERKIQ